MSRLNRPAAVPPYLRRAVRRLQQAACVSGLLWVLFPVQLMAGQTISPLYSLQGQLATESLPIGQGRWTLVMLWASDCGICKEQFPSISAFHNRHTGKLADVVGIALDGVEGAAAVESVLERHDISFPTWLGNFHDVAEDYTVLTEETLYGTPVYLLFNPEGELVGNNPGPLSEGSIERFIASQ